MDMHPNRPSRPDWTAVDWDRRRRTLDPDIVPSINALHARRTAGTSGGSYGRRTRRRRGPGLPVTTFRPELADEPSFDEHSLRRYIW